MEYRFRFLDGEEEAESKEGACAKANIRGERGKESLTEMIGGQNMKQRRQRNTSDSEFLFSKVKKGPTIRAHLHSN